MAEPFLSEIRMMSFNFAPKGWALCNGQLLPINQNQALFSLLGTTYGGMGRRLLRCLTCAVEYRSTLETVTSWAIAAASRLILFRSTNFQNIPIPSPARSSMGLQITQAAQCPPAASQTVMARLRVWCQWTLPPSRTRAVARRMTICSPS